MLQVEPDSVQAELSGWLARSDADRIIVGQYMPLAQKRLEDLGARDWWSHEDVDVVMDGKNSSYLDLRGKGFWPLLDVTSLTIDTSVQVLTDYALYPEGHIRLKDSTYPAFTKGTQNIALNLDWGYATVPDDVRVGHALLTAAYVLQHMERSQSTAPGMVGGVQQIIYDNFRVVNYQQGRYYNSIKNLLERSRQVALSYRTASATGLMPSDPMLLVGTPAKFVNLEYTDW
jgi:hypothetical protein